MSHIELPVQLAKQVEQKKDSENRNWLFTQNNPTMTDEEFYSYLENLNHVKYFVFCREKAPSTGTIHFQGYIEFVQSKLHSTVRNLLPKTHLLPRGGTKKDCIDYVKKQGRFADKKDTQIGEIYEFGETVEQGGRKDLIEIHKEITLDRKHPDELLIERCLNKQQYDHAKNLYNVVIKQDNRKQRRLELKQNVFYIYGKTEVGKTRYVLDKHGDENVFIMSNYAEGNWDKEKFDGYEGEKVILFDEFRSNIPLGRMLRYLDIYYCLLPARYADKIAQYTTVYITSNWTLEQQYKNIQEKFPLDWQAFKRRISKIINLETNSKQSPVMLEPVSDKTLDTIF